MSGLGKFIAVVILVALSAVAVIALYANGAEMRAQDQLDLTAKETAATIDPSLLPMIVIGDDGEAVTVYGAYEMDLVGRHYNDQAIDLAKTGYNALLDMNESDNETVQKVVRNMAWPPAVMMIAAAVIVLAIAFIFWLAKKK